MCAGHPKLANIEADWFPVGMTLAHSHINQVLKNIKAAVQSDIEGITDASGKILFELVERRDRKIAPHSRGGLRWELFPAKMAEERPEALHDLSAAANIKHGTHLMQTEMQALVRLGDAAVPYLARAESGAKRVAYERAKSQDSVWSSDLM